MLLGALKPVNLIRVGWIGSDEALQMKAGAEPLLRGFTFICALAMPRHDLWFRDIELP